MNAKKWGLLGFVLVGLAMFAGCQNNNAHNDDVMMMSMDQNRIEWQQGLTGFPHPRILYP